MTTQKLHHVGENNQYLVPSAENYRETYGNALAENHLVIIESIEGTREGMYTGHTDQELIDRKKWHEEKLETLDYANVAVAGKTESGKIFYLGNHPDHKPFTQEEHREVGKLHMKHASPSTGLVAVKNTRYAHKQMGMRHLAVAEWLKHHNRYHEDFYAGKKDQGVFRPWN